MWNMSGSEIIIYQPATYPILASGLLVDTRYLRISILKTKILYYHNRSKKLSPDISFTVFVEFGRGLLVALGAWVVWGFRPKKLALKLFGGV